MVTGPNQNVSFSFSFHDDGPSPGNTTPSDNVNLKIEFAQDVVAKVITVNNLKPQALSNPHVSFEKSDGKLYAVASIDMGDRSAKDVLTGKVKWSDGVVDQTTEFSWLGGGCNEKWFTLRKEITKLTDALPLIIGAADDDSGSGSRNIGYLSVPINADDDNGNSVVDLDDKGFADDDLKAGASLAVAGMNSSGTYLLSYNIDVIRVWDTNTKDHLIVPYGYVGFVPNWISTIPYTGQSFFVEGVAGGDTTMTLTWLGDTADAVCDYGIIYGNSTLVHIEKIESDPEGLAVFENYLGNKKTILDSTWKEVDPSADGRIWQHNEHLWRLTFVPGLDYGDVHRYRFWAVPFEKLGQIPENTELNQSPTPLLTQLGSNLYIDSPTPDGIDGPKAYFRGRPPIGDWVYVAVVSFIRDGQTVFRTSKILGKQNGLPMSAVETAFTPYLNESGSIVNPNWTAEGQHSKPVIPGDIIYAERNAPTPLDDSNRDWRDLGVWVMVVPAVTRPLSAPLTLKVFDPDNFLSSGDDPNDSSGPTSIDNFDSTPAHQSPQIDSPAARLKSGLNATSGQVIYPLMLTGNTLNLNLERVHLVLHIDDPQPGNNWQVAVHDERSVVVDYDYSNSGTGAQGNGVDLRRRGNSDAEYVPSDLRTRKLTALRTLWIEQDWMKTATNATPPGNRGVFDQEQGCNGCDDPIEFDKSTDLTMLAELLTPILVDVKPLPNSMNTRREADFRHYTSPVDGDVSRTVGNVRDVQSQDYFWVVQIAAIYEAFEDKDNDDNESFFDVSWTLGYSAFPGNDGPTVVYQEEIRDVSLNSSLPPGSEFVDNFFATVVAHEILHRFFGEHYAPPKVWEHGIMDGKSALVKEPNEADIVLSGIQRQWIQGRRSPR